MRVAVRHTDKSHDNGDWFAFQEGRTQGFTHPLTGESYTPEQVTEALLVQAQERFPAEEGYEHRIETLHTTGIDDDGHAVGAWYPVGTSDLPRAGTGEVTDHELTIRRDQEASAE